MELKRLIEQYLTEEEVGYTVDFYNSSFKMITITFCIRDYTVEIKIVNENISKAEFKRLYGDDLYEIAILSTRKNDDLPKLTETLDEFKVLELIKEVVDREQE